MTKKSRKILSTISLIGLLILNSCQSSRGQHKDNYHEISLYKRKIQNFDCTKLSNEMIYLGKNLELMNKQLKNSSFDAFMEKFVSIGIHRSGKNNLKERVDLFKQKKNIVSINQKNKSCHEN